MSLEPGDRVRAEFTGDWTTAGTVKLSTGQEISVFSASGTPIATVVVLSHASALAPGQVWQRNTDEALFTINLDGTTRVAVPAVQDGVDVPIPEQAFDRGRFTLLFDPRA